MERMLVDAEIAVDRASCRSTSRCASNHIDASWSRVCRVTIDGSAVSSGVRELTLDTDPLILEQIVFNLLGNAASHSTPESTVVCESARTPDGGCELRISNPADTLDSEDLQHIFERFWRKDLARTGGHHSGLGLSIVKELANALGVQASAELTQAGIFIFTLRFPVENGSRATSSS